jgi:hypothetical protein
LPEFEIEDCPAVGFVVEFGSSCIEDFFQAQQNRMLAQEVFPAAMPEKKKYVGFLH